MLVSFEEYQITELRHLLKKKDAQIKRFKKGREYAKLDKRNAELRIELANSQARADKLWERLRIQEALYNSLSQKYVKLDRKFEANFKFHEYIRDTLDRTADLMENYDAVREQTPPVQEGIPTAEGA
jgi:chromosome segregation ATPase